eukprot:6154450-Amphidinium_carterae.1
MATVLDTCNIFSGVIFVIVLDGTDCSWHCSKGVAIASQVDSEGGERMEGLLGTEAKRCRVIVIGQY